MMLTAERNRSRRKNRRRGASMVEFSLVFILFLMMVAGVFEVGRAVWTYNSLMLAAKEGARYAMVHGAKNPIQSGGASVVQFTKGRAVGIPSNSINATVVYLPDDQPGSQVRVTASHTLKTIVGPLLGLGSQVTLAGSSTKTIVN